MLEKIKDALAVLRAGQAVDNPAAWKTHQVRANQVTTLLASIALLARAFGYDLHLDDATLAAVGTGVFAVVNWVFTVASTDKVGLTGAVVVAAAVAGPAGDASAGGQGPLDPQPRSEPAEPVAASAVRPWSAADQEAP